MSKKERAKITSHNCADCIHNSVCNYKQDYLDICNAVLEANVYKQTDRNKVKVSNVMNYSDILDEIVIKCKHYYNGSKIRIDSNGMTFQPYPQPHLRDYSTVSVVSDTPNSVTTISNATKAKINPPSTIETTADYIFR